MEYSESGSKQTGAVRVQRLDRRGDLEDLVLVENPEQVMISELKGQASTIIEISVDPEDRRYVIGRQGRNTDAIRHLVACAGIARNRKIRLSLLGDDRQ